MWAQEHSKRHKSTARGTRAQQEAREHRKRQRSPQEAREHSKRHKSTARGTRAQQEAREHSKRRAQQEAREHSKRHKQEAQEHSKRQRAPQEDRGWSHRIQNSCSSQGCVLYNPPLVCRLQLFLLNIVSAGLPLRSDLCSTSVKPKTCVGSGPEALLPSNPCQRRVPAFPLN